MDAATLRERFLDTYKTTSEASVHELVVQYERAQQYLAERPNAGSYAVTAAVEAPRGRIRPWVKDGAMPDAYRGWQVVERHDWDATEGARHQALTRLVAGVFAGGAISATSWVPTWSCSDADDRAHLEEVFQTAGLTPRFRDREGRRTDTLEPASNASVFGRLLTARGAPVGRDPDNLAVPAYLFTLAQRVAVAGFCETYLRLRGVDRPDKGLVQVYEQNRSNVYHDDLARLFEAVFGDEEVRRHKYGLYVDRAVVNWVNAD